MTQIADAPWIREAEMYGDTEIVEPSERDYRNFQYKDSVVEILTKSKELLDKALAMLESVPEDTEWTDGIYGLCESVEDIGFSMDHMKEEAERW